MSYLSAILIVAFSNDVGPRTPVPRTLFGLKGLVYRPSLSMLRWMCTFGLKRLYAPVIRSTRITSYLSIFRSVCTNMVLGIGVKV